MGGAARSRSSRILPAQAVLGALVGALSIVLLAACQTPLPTPPTPVATASPLPAIPQFGSEGPRLPDCYPQRVRAQGVPREVPVPRTVTVQGPDRYAGPYPPSGDVARKISGRGFAYEVSSSAPLVGGFYEGCLQSYGPFGWRRVSVDRAIVVTIPRRSEANAVVLIAGSPSAATIVVVFDSYRITRTA